MKKISILAIFATLAVPAFAEDTVKTTETKDVSEKIESSKTDIQDVAVKDEDVSEVKSDKKPYSKTKFPRGLQFGLGASVTSGVNGFVGYANKNFDSFWWKRIGGRFDFGTTSPIKSVINSAIDSQMNDGVDIGDGMTITDGNITAQHFGALVDFYPFGNTWFFGGLRLTGGYMFGKLDISAKLDGTVDGLPTDPIEFELNGEQYCYPGGIMKGYADVSWNYSGPYLGTGFDLGLIWGIKIYMDAGVVFTSKTAQANLNVPITGLQYYNGSGWVAADSTILNQDKAQALKEANDELGKIQIFPIVKLGFMYRF